MFYTSGFTKYKVSDYITVIVYFKKIFGIEYDKTVYILDSNGKSIRIV